MRTSVNYPPSPSIGPLGGDGSLRLPLYVRMSVCDSCPALTTPTNFLIFGMKVGDHEWRKVTEPDFPGKIKIWAFSPNDVISRPIVDVFIQ